MSTEYNFTSPIDCEKNALEVFGCSAAVYLIGVVTLVIVRFVHLRRKKDSEDEDSLDDLIRTRQMRWLPKKAESLLTGKPILGKILILIRSALYTTCSVIYVVNTYRFKGSIPTLCIPIYSAPRYFVELCANCVFALIFLIKVISSQNLLTTWLSMDILIDHFTILPIAFALVFGFYQYNFGFLYFTRLTKITETLVLLHLIDDERSIRKMKLVSKLLAAWFTLAGVILLFERIGDFWIEGKRDPTGPTLSYFDCFYFLLVTVATVGYGDIVCTTYIGRVVIIMVIIGALVSITTHMSELYDLFHISRQYSGTFNKEYHPRHVIVCGSINYQSVSVFMHAFVNADRGRFDKNIMMLFMSENNPDTRLKALLKRESVHATFLRGDATSPKDLKRAKARFAEAVIVLSDGQSSDPAKDDWENIMRVVSVKNLHSKCRILCVLTMMDNKALMSNIPGWREGRTDEFDRAICTTQLKLGLMSLNCLARGASTLLTNLMVRVPIPTKLDEHRKRRWRSCTHNITDLPKRFPAWIRNYFRGTRYGLYTVKFSPSFDEMPFQTVVSIAMQHLQLLLVAVHIYSQKDTVEQIVINPGTYLRINSQQMRAIVLADSFLHAQHLRAYCVACNSDSGFHLHEPLRTCRSRLQLHNSDPAIDKGSVTSRYGSLEVRPSKGLGFRISQLLKPFVSKKVLKRALSSEIHHKVAGNAHKYEQPKLQDGTKPKTTIDIMRDSTGLFYWVPDRPFTTACLSLRDLIQWSLSGHILVCLTKQTTDAKLGLASFVMPLRSTRIPKEELRPIVFLCDENLVRTEWYSLRNFPKIYVLSGSPLSRAYLRAAGVEKCSTCVILSCSDELPAKQSLLADKENILCALNIRQMLAESRDQDEEDNIRSDPMVITALSDMKSGSLLSITNEYKSKNGLIRLSPHYAAGSMFASPVLNSLASNVFFDPTALTFLETVILGGSSHEVEKLFAEDSGFFPDLLGHTVTSLEFTGFNSDTQTDGGQQHSTPRDQMPAIGNQQSTVSLFTGESTSGGANFSDESVDTDQPISMKAPDGESLMLGKHAALSSVHEKDSDGECVAATDRRKSMSVKTGRHRISWANLDESKCADHLTVDSDLLSTNMKRSLMLPWRLSTSTSFLSYTTETGDSVKMRAPYIRLLPLSTLGVDPVKIMRETNAYLTFGNLFEMVLMASSTICIGLYRRVVDEIDEDQQSERSDTVTREVGNQIERYVYTFPDVDTEIMAEDLVYCFASVKEIRGTDD